ncbi:hypothetical protein D1227_00980 [Henriciella mobilis]|uniref:hypothetical protein n=1 Tax=Henriciella mobilis TaxID=2305467 RepID=UPI000E6672E8|nr:hypothetical protein [Henriciella mobilis]RIJ24966.1 hypothetical protein D1227_00980 [Henriciella mobilis]
MSQQTLEAMAVVASVFAAIFAFRALYVVAFYRSWTLAELLGMQDDGWESERMKKNRRTFWR